MRSFATTAVCLKRTDTGEADRVVTLFSREYGKLTVIAKGCRRLNSSRAASLEPGTVAKIYLVETKGMSILTQATLLNDFSCAKKDLSGMRKIMEVLEMVDSLLVEEDAQPQVFSHTLAILTHLNEPTQSTQIVRTHLVEILKTLGFVDNVSLDFTAPIRDFVEHVTSRKLKAFAYLTV
ncbi:MAG TPA: DNA repair protein RecO [Patescibacteria group bacterium]|nr:DNA repair protein RecO [Patescibacteria group bacterium]